MHSWGHDCGRNGKVLEVGKHAMIYMTRRLTMNWRHWDWDYIYQKPRRWRITIQKPFEDAAIHQTTTMSAVDILIGVLLIEAQLDNRWYGLVLKIRISRKRSEGETTGQEESRLDYNDEETTSEVWAPKCILWSAEQLINTPANAKSQWNR